MDAAAWTLTVDGLVETPLTLGIDDLRRRFEVVTAALTLECAGNGRAFFDPPATGAQWTYGAVACSEWTGVRLADVLKAAGVKDGVVYTAHEGADTHTLGRAGQAPALARRAHRQGHGPGHAGRLRPERAAHPPHERRAAPPGRSRMAGLVLPEMAHAGLAAGPGPRRGEDDRHLLPRARPARWRRARLLAEAEFVIIGAMPVKSLITHPATGQRTARERGGRAGPRLGR